MEKRVSRYQTLRWQLARERIGELVRENHRVNQEMSPRLVALIKKIENGNAELSTEVFRAREAKNKTISARPIMTARRFPPPLLRLPTSNVPCESAWPNTRACFRL